MVWIARELGSTVANITFQLATAITDDGEGGDASGTSNIIIPVRLVTRNVGSNDEQQFPGANQYSYLFWGWVNDRNNPTFPNSLRHQDRPIGEVTLQDRPGRIQCWIDASPNQDAACRIGEKFMAGWRAI